MNIKKMSLLFILILCVTINGCFQMGISIHPLYTDEDLISNPALAGNWITLDNTGTFTFEALGDKEYRLSFTEIEKDKEMKLLGEIEVHLFQLGENIFMDWFPEEPESGNEFYNSHLIPLHSFWKVYLENDTLKLAPFNFEWLEDMIKNKALNIRHEVRESEIPSMKEEKSKKIENVILTASTKELQMFVLEHLDKAFVPPQRNDLFSFWFYRQK